MWVLSLTLFAFSVVDALLTLHAIERGATEANPAMASVLAHHPAAFVGIKLALTALGIAILHRLHAQRTVVVLLFAYSSLIGYHLAGGSVL